jgi:hypothetical protein
MTVLRVPGRVGSESWRESGWMLYPVALGAEGALTGACLC